MGRRVGCGAVKVLIHGQRGIDGHEQNIRYRTPPYDPFTDFAPVTLTAKTMQLLIVNAASDVKTVKELIATAKTQPGKLNYGAGTITTKLTGHLQ